MCVVKLVSTLGKGSEKKGSRREIGQSSLGLGSLSPACTCNALQIATQPRHMKMLNTRPVASAGGGEGHLPHHSSKSKALY